MAVDTKIQWAEVPKFPGYRVSNMGDVQSCRRTVGLGRGRGAKSVIDTSQWHPLKPHCNQRGYLFVNLGKGNTRLVHLLVAAAFHGPKPIGMECRHMDGDKTNNAATNLQYGTPKQNMEDQKRHGTRISGDRHHWTKLTTLQVKAVRQLWATGGWKQDDLAQLFGVSQPTISSVVNRGHRVTDHEEATDGL